MALTDEMVRDLVLQYLRTDVGAEEAAHLRPLLEKQLERMQQLHALDLGREDPRTMAYITDGRIIPPSAIRSDRDAAQAPLHKEPAATTSADDIAKLTMHELATLIERREVSPVEITRRMLERIQALDGRLHTFITVRSDEALEQARIAEEEIGRGGYRGPLYGIPMGIKDNIAVGGWPTTNGSALMTDNVTDYDATTVARLRQAGAIIVGKNNMHEWAMGGTSVPSAFGAVHNPWDESRVPGGSSGGSAAAVSASLIYASVGTDNKGSVRNPASFCGIVGLKPTYGLVSRFGELPASSANTDHLGPLTKDVTDAALMLNVLAGYDPLDPTSIAQATQDYAAGIDTGVRGLRIGVVRNFFFEQATPEVQQSVEKAIGVLASLGAEVRDVVVPSLQHMTLADPAWVNELRTYLLPFIPQGRRAFADAAIWDRVVLNELTRAADQQKALRLRGVILRELQATFEQVDVLATPTNMTTAFPIERSEAQRAATLASTSVTLTAPFNLSGHPSISVPCGFGADGLPIALMLTGRHWEDGLVLRAAYAYEQAATGGYAPAPIV
jgi:aspartyl-tRNA(Asn)/glutamyl-tRNA(Gln) amidotransferase subunit A